MIIKVRSRTFVVSFNEAGEIRIIKERKTYAPGRPFEALFDSPYWHHSAKVPKRGIVAEIMAEALRRLNESSGA